VQDENALREVAKDCVHCGFCLPACPTYQLWAEEMDSPRGRIYLVNQLLDGLVQSLPVGSIVTVDIEGTGEEAKFTFTSRPKPDSVPDAADLVAATASEPVSGTNPSVAPSSDGPGTAQALG